MLSKPDGWNFNALRLSKSLPEGRDAIRAAQNRAVEAGWVVIVDERSQTGEFHRVILVRNSRQVPWEIVGVPDPGLPDPGEVGPGVTVAVSKNLEASTEIASTEVQDLAPAKPPRPRDPIWDALVEIYGEPTSAGRGAMNTAAKALRDYGTTPDEIFVTVSGLANTDFNWAVTTPNALAKHFGQREALMAQAKAPKIAKVPDRAAEIRAMNLGGR